MSTDTSSIISEYDMLTEFTDIAANYFVGVNVSKLRTGVFGYISEGMAHTTSINLIDSMLRARETNISTAQRMSTLELAAAYLEISDYAAIPATIDSFIAIPVDALSTKGTKVGNDYSLVISKDTVITILGHEFLLDYDITILAKAITVGYNYSSQYTISDENAISDINNPYIITSVRVYNGVSYIFMRVTLRQVTKTYCYYTTILNDSISAIGIEFTYTGQLSYFNVWYMPPNSTTYVMLPLRNILASTAVEGNYLVYDITEDGIIKLSAESQFIPAFNSQLRIDIFTTTGASGKFTYTTGTTSVVLKSYDGAVDYGKHDMCTSRRFSWWNGCSWY